MTIREVELFALFAAMAAFWAQIKAVLDWPRRWFVVGRDTGEAAGNAILGYLKANASSKPRDSSFYRGERVHVRPLGRVCLVFAESLLYGPQLFWLRRRPIWYSYTCGIGSTPNSYKFFYVRGTRDWDAFLGDVARWDDSIGQVKAGRRYFVRVHGGRGVATGENGKFGGATPPPTATNDSDARDLSTPGRGCRLLHWQHEDIGQATPLPLEHMSLRPEIQAIARDVSRFMGSKEWCEEKGIPWRRGWMLGGPPGTGKTSFVRGVGVEHDLPVHVFDLGSMENMGLRYAWSIMLDSAPCIALIEDVDAIYDGRDLRTPGVGPTFDCLINCIGGVSTADGVLVFVTTNRPECIDPALRRGGRLDVEVEFRGLDQDGVVKMVRRILGDDPQDLQRVLCDPTMRDMSPANLQEKLCKLALERRFGDAA